MRRAWLLPGVFALLAAHPARAANEAAWATQVRHAMGTLWTVEAHAPDVERALDAAFDEVRRLDASLSTYRADSELSRVNREAARDWTPVSAETRRLIGRALGVAAESGGAFDPTVGPLVQAWGFKHLDYRMPDPGAIAAARARVGWTGVQLSEARGVRFMRPGLELDLGAIAKGYAVDRALAVLRARGADAARVDAGGNQGVFGPSPEGGAWVFGIRHPRREGEILDTVPLTGGGISTSGDDQRGFWHEGVRYGHVLDPRTGWPVRGRPSVTVVAPDAETADALSTALLVLGSSEGEPLLARHPGCRALFVSEGDATDSLEVMAASSDGRAPMAARRSGVARKSRSLPDWR